MFLSDICFGVRLAGHFGPLYGSLCPAARKLANVRGFGLGKIGVCSMCVCVCMCALFMQGFMEDVKSRGPFIYSVLESAQAFLAQHPFQEPDEMLPDGKGLLLFLTKFYYTPNYKLY